MSVTRKDLRRDIARRLADYRMSTATGGSTTTLIDTTRLEDDDDRFNLAYLWIPARGSIVDVERQISDYAGSTRTFTFAAYSSMTIISGTEYELWCKWKPAEVTEAINMAIRDAYPSWFTEVLADKLVVCDNKLEYTLPTMRDLLWVREEQSGENDSGTATGGTCETDTMGILIDTSKSWTVNEYAGWHVVIYDGTGAGQYAVVSSNTATQLVMDLTLNLVVAGTYNWTVASDSTSDYMVKNIPERASDFIPIYAWRTDKVRNPTTLYLTEPATSGMYLRLHYLTEPAELTADTDTTDVSQEWIARQALAHLYLMRMNDAPGLSVETMSNLGSVNQQLAKDYRDYHAMRFPSRSIRLEYRTNPPGLPLDWPF